MNNDSYKLDKKLYNDFITLGTDIYDINPDDIIERIYLGHEFDLDREQIALIVGYNIGQIVQQLRDEKLYQMPTRELNSLAKEYNIPNRPFGYSRQGFITFINRHHDASTHTPTPPTPTQTPTPTPTPIHVPTPTPRLPNEPGQRFIDY
jgi:hypothetical protein